MINLPITLVFLVASRILLKILGLVLLFLLNFPIFWLGIYFLAALITEALEFAVYSYSKKYPNLKNSYYLLLSFLNSFLVLYFIYVTNLTFTDFYVVGFLIVLASTVQGGPLSGLMSGFTTASFYGLFLYEESAPPVYYFRSVTFFVLSFLFTVLMRVASQAVKEKETVKRQYEKEIETLKDEFLAVAAHNLLSPITSLKGYLSLLTTTRRVSRKERKFYLERVSVSTERLEEIVNELISVAVLEKPEKVLFLEYVDFLELVSRVADDFHLLAKEKNIELKTFLPRGEIPKLLLDPRRMRQAISNLLSNAIKFTNAGGTVELRVEITARRLKIVVKDTGIGIAEEKLANLFQKFFHAHSYLGGLQSQGTGLGLYITKLIVGAHGGKIKVTSQEGEGSTFTIILPIKS